MTTISTNTPVTTAAPSASYKSALVVVTTLFFMWGFLTCLNDILVPHLKPIFDLSYAKIMFIQFAFFSAYFLFSVPMGKIVEWIGYKWTMVAGLFTLSAAPKSMDEIRQMSSDVLQAYRLQQASSIKGPYLALGLIAIALGIAIALFKLPPVPAAQRQTGDRPAQTH